MNKDWKGCKGEFKKGNKSALGNVCKIEKRAESTSVDSDGEKLSEEPTTHLLSGSLRPPFGSQRSRTSEACSLKNPYGCLWGIFDSFVSCYN